MRIASLIAHPRPTSFCHALSERAREALTAFGCEIIHHDLYAEGFDPCLTAEEAYSVGDTLEKALSSASDSTVRKYRAVASE
jgi:NAD(P)H dehydrogenase (quinone)